MCDKTIITLLASTLILLVLVAGAAVGYALWASHDITSKMAGGCQASIESQANFIAGALPNFGGKK